jgi:Htaa
MTRSRSLAVLLVAAAASLATTAPPAAAAVHTIAAGSLGWDVKQSWREYIGDGSQAGGGATITGWAEKPSGGIYPEGFEFPVASGTFDDATDTTTLQLDGYVHFRAWYGIVAPGKYALDTKFSDLEVVIGPTEQVLRGTHTGYLRSDPGGELHEDVDVVLSKFDIAGATTDFSGGESKWTDIPTVAGPGFDIYGESTVVDPTSFEYAGPGGAPDLSETWDEPGIPGLETGASWLSDPASKARVLYAALNDDVVHTVDLVAARTVNAKLVVAAYDAETLAPVGTPYTWAFPGAVATDRQELRTAFDPETDSVFFVTFNEGAARDQATVRRAVWDPVAQDYDVEQVGGLGALNNSRRVFGLAWNPVKDELAAIAYAGSTADPYQTDTLHRFHLDGGSWVAAQTPLRLSDEGEWAGASGVTSPFGPGSLLEKDDEPLAVARDGSYVAAPRSGKATVSGTPRYYPALHVAVAADGSVAVEPIAGTTTPRGLTGTYFGFASLSADVDGSLLLHNSSQEMDAYARIDIVGGNAVKVGGIFDAPEDISPPNEVSGFANSMVADAARGRVWATDTFSPKGHRLHVLEGDEVLASYVHSEFPASSGSGSYARLEVAPDGAVYLPIKDPSSGRLGYRRLAFTGIVPEVTTQPVGQSVALGVGEQSEQAQFTVAIANGADSIQWQASGPGQAAFTDLVGQTGTTLSVEATPADDGTAYRAKVSNGAGAIVSDAVPLDVDFAPAIVNDLANRTVAEGVDAVFLLSVDSDPEADVEWQRRAGGFWQAIAPGDDNFELSDSSLTVRDTNTEQTGSLFRAKLTNSLGTVHSRNAKLTVAPKVAIPPGGLDLEDVSLEWTGSSEMQKVPFFGDSNFFSAGASDGEEAAYDAFADNAAVYQVSSSGAETLATWATRAAHVSSGGHQLVRLYGGDARIEPDGSARVEWDGSWSVNFYGGLVPFAFTDPELVVDADGAGNLIADMSGCESSQANPNDCTPFAAVPDVTVATFSGVEVDPAGAVTIAPDYAGVEVTVSVPFVPQDRVVAGWGAWPQSFVDFQVKTGLSSHWYSSGGAFDPYKAPDPFTVDFDGEALPSEPRPEPTSPAGNRQPKPGSATDGGTAQISTAGGARPVSRKRLATIATLACPGDGFCAVVAPRWVELRIAGKLHRARVIAPRVLEAGAGGEVKVRLSKALLRKLGRRTATGRMPVMVRSQAGAVRRMVAVRIRRP